MALKPTASWARDDLDYDAIMNATGERGGIVCTDNTTASGVVIDQGANKVNYVANPSGVSARGLLFTDMVNKDLSQTHLDHYKYERQQGTKCVYAKGGKWTTNFVYPGHSPAPGDDAYVGHSGYIGNADVATDHVDATGTSRRVGTWISAKDENGYATIQLNIR